MPLVIYKIEASLEISAVHVALAPFPATSQNCNLLCFCFRAAERRSLDGQAGLSRRQAYEDEHQVDLRELKKEAEEGAGRPVRDLNEL